MAHPAEHYSPRLFKALGEKSVTRIPGMVKVEFNPVRVTDVPGMNAFLIRRFAVSRQENMIVFEAEQYDSAGPKNCDLRVPRADRGGTHGGRNVRLQGWIPVGRPGPIA